MHILILNDRAILAVQDRSFSLGLERAFLLGQHRLELPRLQAQLVDIGLALPSSDDRQEPVRL
jgi:hypothetical protein